MNEQKIKELVLATGVVEYDWRENMKYSSSEELVEKLIEVVVRECAEIAGCNGHVSGFSLGDLIKERFGVQ